MFSSIDFDGLDGGLQGFDGLHGGLDGGFVGGLCLFGDPAGGLDGNLIGDFDGARLLFQDQII